MNEVLLLECSSNDQFHFGATVVCVPANDNDDALTQALLIAPLRSTRKTYNEGAVVGVLANDLKKLLTSLPLLTMSIIVQHPVLPLWDLQSLARTPTIAGNSKIFTLRRNAHLISWMAFLFY